MGGGKGGGSTTMFAYDPVASAKMATIAERQQAMAEEQYGYYKEYYQPYEIEQVQANRELLPLMTENSRLLYEQQASEIGASSGVAEKFYKEATEGVDPAQRAMKAGADVAQGFDEATGTMNRNMARMGVSPESGNFGRAQRLMATDRAKALGAARTQAREQAEAESFSRLGSAMTARGNVMGYGGHSIQTADPYARAAGSYAGAAGTQGALATRTMSQTTQNTQPNDILQGLISGGIQLGVAKLMS